MLVAVLSGFMVAVLMFFFGSFFKGRLSVSLTLLPLLLFCYFASLAATVSGSGPQIFRYEWVPALNMDLNFNLDGLSLLFALMITGIGTLVFAYTSSYMKGHEHLHRFYGYLSMFMASMLGLVLSDNVFAVITFWELTSISSFFLIGFNNREEGSRRSALTALAITGGGGFMLLAGFVLLSIVSGTNSIVAMSSVSDIIRSSPSFAWILVFLLIGAFTKSAQFPFHFWLPGAMKAPTPVSTYLHSATMVKAGVYLLARMTPTLGDNVYWNNTLLVFGGITMLYAAVHTIFRTELKSILAYSTISALGVLVFLLGLGTPEAYLAVAVFLVVHALYKAALFLITGIIDHETGTRDVTKLSGLRNVLWPVAIAGVLAAISSAGLPLTFGFVGKELIYEATLHREGLSIFLTAAAIITNILLLYAGFVAGYKPFEGKLTAQYADVRLPSPLLWIPPLLLGALGVLYGIYPASIDEVLIRPVVSTFISTPSESALKLWHGFNTVLILSGITLLAGILLYLFLKPSPKRAGNIARYDFLAPSALMDRAGKLFTRFSAAYTHMLQNGYLRVYVLTIMFFLIGLLGYKVIKYVDLDIDYSALAQVTIYEALVAGIMIYAVYTTLFSKSRLLAVASMGVVGLCICLIFVFYSAPDLAMTQFTIDTLTVVLFVLVLYRLPGYLDFRNRIAKIRDGIISIAFGFLIAVIALQVLHEPLQRETSQYYAENAYLLGKGKNIVNVILVDFRGFDTMIEIIVLSIAALGVYSLLKLKANMPDGE